MCNRHSQPTVMRRKSKTAKSRKECMRKNYVRELGFPFRRVVCGLCQSTCSMHIKTSAKVYLSAVLKYLTTYIIKLAGPTSKESEQTRIMPAHVQLTIRGDADLHKLVNDLFTYQQSCSS